MVALAAGIFSANVSRRRAAVGAEIMGDGLWTAVLSDWRGAAMLSRQARPHCDSVFLALPSSRCGKSDARAPRIGDLAALAVETQKRATPDAARRLALLDVATAHPDAAGWNRVVSTVDAAAKQSPDDVSILSDQAALRLQRYAEHPSVADLIIGLEIATNAIEIAPSFYPACFNRALALTWSGMRNLAEAEWLRCASLPTSGARVDGPKVVDRAGYAATRNGTASTPASYEAAHDKSWIELLPRWAREASAAMTTAARASLDEAGDIAMRLEAAGVDSGVGIAVRQIARAERERDTLRLRSLSTALRYFGQIRSDIARRDPQLQKARLDSALQLVRDGDPLASLLELERAAMVVRDGDLRRAVGMYSRLRLSVHGSILRARAMRGRAASFAALGNPLEALADFDRAEALCQRAVLPECALAAPVMSAQMAAEAGDLAETEKRAVRAVRASGAVPTISWTWSTCLLLRRLADRSDAVRAMRAFDDEAVIVARQLRRPDLASQTLIAAARSRIERNDPKGVVELLTELSERWIPHLRGQDRRFAEVSLLALRGELVQYSDPRRSVMLLDSALVSIGGNQNEFWRTPVRIARARARLAVGDTAAMLKELENVLARLHRRDEKRESVFTQARISVLSGNVADISARIFRARGDAVGALRVLSDVGQDSGRQRACCDDPGSLMIAVRHTRDSLWVWRRFQRKWSLRTFPLTADEIERASSLDPAALELLSTQLFRSIAEVGTLAAVCIDARGLPSRIPWGALRLPKQQQYLVEQSTVRLVASGLRPCRTQLRWRAPQAVRLIGGAEVSGTRALPAAARELGALSAVWKPGAEASPVGMGAAEALAWIEGADLVHFSGHAILDRDQPERSYLFVPESADSAISGTMILRHAFSRRPLVILAACETRGHASGRGSGFDSLAGAFLAAGAAAVIGSGWPVDDAPTALMMRELHLALRRGMSPEAALRDVQIRAIRSGNRALGSPRIWAAFQIMSRT